MRCLLSRCLGSNLQLHQSDRVRRPCETRPRPEKLPRAHVPRFLLLSSHAGCDSISLRFNSRRCVIFSPSLSLSFGKNSSWIVFLEEETNVRVTRLVQVLAEFDKSKVRMRFLPPTSHLSSSHSAAFSCSADRAIIVSWAPAALTVEPVCSLIQSMEQVQTQRSFRPPVKSFFLLIGQRGWDCSLKIIH